VKCGGWGLNPSPVATSPANPLFEVAEDSERLSNIHIELFISLDSEGNSSHATIVNVSFHLVKRQIDGSLEQVFDSLLARLLWSIS
jgi:hypothetical protein